MSKTELRVAVLVRERDPPSLIVYQQNLRRALTALGVELVSFGKHDALPAGCDLFWDPGLGMRNPAMRMFREAKVPVVVTFHGAEVFALPLRELVTNPILAARWQARRWELSARWAFVKPRVAAIIAVSKYGAEAVMSAFGFGRETVYAVYHGVDHSLFRASDRIEGEPFLFHVSNGKPRKNLRRMLAAYERLPVTERPAFRLVLAGFRDAVDVPGVEVIRVSVPDRDLASMYANALAFVFPSLEETFGFPIIEAMASGCPVLTSFGSATEEVAGGAALLVDPLSTDDIARGIRSLVSDRPLRDRLRSLGLERARSFTWEASAEAHVGVFQRVLAMAPGASTSAS